MGLKGMLWALPFRIPASFSNQKLGVRITSSPFPKSQTFFSNLLTRRAIFDNIEDDPNYNPLPEERPGGFAWGEGQRLGG